MEILVQHPAINDGAETSLDVDMTPIHELPPTRGGLRRMAEIQITTPLGGSQHKFLNAAFRDRQSSVPQPIRLRTDDHVGMWNIHRVRMPGIPSDGLVRLTLSYAGPAYDADWRERIERAKRAREEGKGKSAISPVPRALI